MSLEHNSNGIMQGRDFSCPLDRTLYMPHVLNCEFYYICSNGFRMTLRCPIGYSFDYHHLTCIVSQLAICYSRAMRVFQEYFKY